MSIIIYHMNDHSISVDQARHATSIVDKYLDTATVKKSTKFYETTLTSDMIFTKADEYTTDVQLERFTRGLNINYRDCIGTLIYLSSKRVYLSFTVHKLAKFSSNQGKVYFEGLVHLLRYIRDNKDLVLKYYDDMKYAPLYYLLRQANIKTENQFIVFSDSSCKHFTDTGRSTGSYIIFYQGRPIDHGTHVPGPVTQSNA